MSSNATHPYRSINIPKNTPFTLQPSPGRGWGAFATRDISPGAIILQEEPLFVIRKPHQLITESDVRSAFQHLDAPKKHQFLCIRNNAASSFTNMEAGFAENSFAISDGKTNRGMGCFLLHSRINHSCVPNIKLPNTVSGEEIASYAIREIAAGEELFMCYDTYFECRIRSERHRLLRFECTCKACVLGTRFQQLSDMRRTLIRGLNYLIGGKDIDGQRHDALTSIIVDPELKVAAETSRIPPSSLFIYSILQMTLTEQEGLMDNLLVERWAPGIWALLGKFTTERDTEVAKLAILQETWTQRFCVASRLWGQ